MFKKYFKAAERKNTASIKWDYQMNDYGADNLLPFSIADSDYRVHQPILDAMKKRIDSGALGYTEADDAYFKAVTDWAAKRHDWEVKPEWIVPVEGIVPTMSYLIEALTSENAGVIVQPPVYYPFYSIAKTEGRRLLKNDLILDDDGYRMDYDCFEKLCSRGAEALILCSPHNPVCRLWTEDEIRKLSEICNRYGVLVVSDEIHWDLALGGRKHFTAGRAEELHERLAVCVSCSKTFNLAGLKTSNIIIPDEGLRKKFQEKLYARYLYVPNTLGLESVKAAYTFGGEWADAQAQFLTENANTVTEFFNKRMPSVKVARPEATFLLWFDFRHYGLSSGQLVERFAKAGAGLNNGKNYGENYDGFIRMNIACPREQLVEGLERIDCALRKN